MAPCAAPMALLTVNRLALMVTHLRTADSTADFTDAGGNVSGGVSEDLECLEADPFRCAKR
jgi:hypothetical protein